MASTVTSTFVTELLHRILGHTSLAQIFLFGAEGSPFWAARKPVRQSELDALKEALDLIELAEAHRPKPFVAKDDSGRFTVAALDGKEDLYVVLFADGAEPSSAEARVLDRVRELAAPHLEDIRRSGRTTH